jgi:hypothetical protein
MAHYAKVNNGIVKKVIVAEADFFNTFVDSSPGTWIQTSYNTHGNQHPEGRPLRGNYAGIGYTYDATNDVFYAPKPYPSWILNESTWLWKAPVDYPTEEGRFTWDETTTSWIEIENV